MASSPPWTHPKLSISSSPVTWSLVESMWGRTHHGAKPAATLLTSLNVLELMIGWSKSRNVMMKISRLYAISELPRASVSKRVFVLTAKPVFILLRNQVWFSWKWSCRGSYFYVSGLVSLVLTQRQKATHKQPVWAFILLGFCGYLNRFTSGLTFSQWLVSLIRTAYHYHGSRITRMCLMMLHSLSQQLTQWTSLPQPHPTQQCLLCHVMTGMMRRVRRVSLAQCYCWILYTDILGTFH